MAQGKDEFRLLKIPDYLQARKAFFNATEPGMVQIGLPNLGVVVRIKGVPKILKVVAEYSVADRCTRLMLFSEHWKPNTYLELIDYAYVELTANATKILSLEVVEWSNYIDMQQFWPDRIRSLSRTTTGESVTSSQQSKTSLEPSS